MISSTSLTSLYCKSHFIHVHCISHEHIEKKLSTKTKQSSAHVVKNTGQKRSASHSQYLHRMVDLKWGGAYHTLGS